MDFMDDYHSLLPQTYLAAITAEFEKALIASLECEHRRKAQPEGQLVSLIEACDISSDTDMQQQQSTDIMTCGDSSSQHFGEKCVRGVVLECRRPRGKPSAATPFRTVQTVCNRMEVMNGSDEIPSSLLVTSTTANKVGGAGSPRSAKQNNTTTSSSIMLPKGADAENNITDTFNGFHNNNNNYIADSAIPTLTEATAALPCERCLVQQFDSFCRISLRFFCSSTDKTNSNGSQCGYTTNSQTPQTDYTANNKEHSCASRRAILPLIIREVRKQRRQDLLFPMESPAAAEGYDVSFSVPSSFLAETSVANILESFIAFAQSLDVNYHLLLKESETKAKEFTEELRKTVTKNIQQPPATGPKSSFKRKTPQSVKKVNKDATTPLNAVKTAHNNNALKTAH